MPRTLLAILISALALTLSASAHDGPKGAVVLIIRHAEKPAAGSGLSPRGEERAKAYEKYFRTFTVKGLPLHLNAIFAASDSVESQRPRLTVEPLAKALNLSIDSHFNSKDIPQLAVELRESQKNKNVLLCWRHREIPDLLRVFGAKPEVFLPGGIWPDNNFDYVIMLTFNKDGNLIPAKTKRISEQLLPGDSK